MNINLDTLGEVFASERFGRTVKFYCRALDGGETDSKVISLTFSSEAIAHDVQMASAWVGV